MSASRDISWLWLARSWRRSRRHGDAVRVGPVQPCGTCLTHGGALLASTCCELERVLPPDLAGLWLATACAPRRLVLPRRVRSTAGSLWRCIRAILIDGCNTGLRKQRGRALLGSTCCQLTRARLADPAGVWHAAACARWRLTASRRVSSTAGSLWLRIRGVRTWSQGVSGLWLTHGRALLASTCCERTRVLPPDLAGGLLAAACRQ